MEVAGSLKYLITIYKTTWCDIPEDHNQTSHQRVNLRSHSFKMFMPIRSVTVDCTEYRSHNGSVNKIVSYEQGSQSGFDLL